MARRRKEEIDEEARIVDAKLMVLRMKELEFERILHEMRRLRESTGSERRALEARQQELQTERQPVNWLPPELIIHIFLAFVESGSGHPAEVYHREPVTLSHVCSRWRSIALSTSQLWIRICVQGEAWNARPIVTFVARSGRSPLSVIFAPPHNLPDGHEHRRALKLLQHVEVDFERMRSIVFHSQGTEAMQQFISVLTRPNHAFKALESLDLSIDAIAASSLLLPTLLPTQLREPAPVSSHLTILRLTKLPLFNIPSHFLPKLLTLELEFPPKKILVEGSTSYVLRMSQLVRFLGCTPRLEELILLDTCPFMDVTLDREDAVEISANHVRVKPVVLLHLRSLQWSYPFASDIHYFLSFFVIPALERFDVDVDEYPLVRNNVALLRGYSDHSASQLFAQNRVIELSNLREITLQCLNEETVGSVLRKFGFPVLEKLDIGHVSGSIQSGRNRAKEALPTFPRLESMFRDPRLPGLTHLTICHFEISAELGKAEAMLGYLPNLVSLTLDNCLGVGKLFECLYQLSAVSGSITRVCSHLDSIELWRCSDVDVLPLIAIASMRNGAHSALNSQSRRLQFIKPKARPMKKLPRQAVGNKQELDQNLPARLRHVRIVGCALIDEDHAESLRAMGVETVLWTSF
ncbi:unnamed protein product [Mycena citricolor]|uniref:F-box domain-containing protein n=1 Tax=Mycena citricolor TaxID=2018698 RepID=A0AAD2HCW7_9AGAR|nr:unnamed protein product [Mycena citricolor]